MTTSIEDARKIVAGMTAGADLFALCVSAGIEPEDAAGIVLAVACLCALADPATVTKLADVIAEAYDAGRREERWEPANGIDAGECAALAALTFILDQAGRDAT